VQEKIPLNLWAEMLSELDLEQHRIVETQYQTDFRCLFGPQGLFGFLGRYGQVPTNVGSGGGVQPLAVLRSAMSVREATRRINDVILNKTYDDIVEAIGQQQQMALERRFTYILGPIKIALRPRLITSEQMNALETYCAEIWADCLTLEQMWFAGELESIVSIEPDELEIARSQPWKGASAIFASDGLFSFGAHVR
jgi:hypothetical protein